MTDVAVIVPTYNRPTETLRAVASVFEQVGDFSLSLVVVDDGSTMEMTDVQSLVTSSGGTFISTQRRGVSSARNEGVRASNSRFIAFLDSDDYWLPGKIAAQLSFFTENPAIRICHTEEKWIRNGSFVNPRVVHAKAKGESFARSLELCCISPSAVMLERSLFEEMGEFDEELRVCEDYDLWLRVTSRYQVGLVEEAYVVKHGGHDDQLSRSEVAMDRFRIFSMIKLLAENKLSPPQRDICRAVLRERIARLVAGAKKRGNEPFAALLQDVEGFADSSIEAHEVIRAKVLLESAVV